MIEFLLFLLGKCMFFCSSIGWETFPKPLSSEEEQLCLKLTREGNQLAKEKLIKHNLRLVAHIVKKYQGAENSEDLISVGTIGLIKAINSYKMEKGTQLATFAARCIENEILMLLRSNKKYKNDVSLNDRVGVDKDGNELSLIDLLYEDDAMVLEKVEKSITKTKFINFLKANLSEREYMVLNLRFGLVSGLPLPQREVAKFLKISRSYISRIEKKSIEKLRKIMKRSDFL